MAEDTGLRFEIYKLYLQTAEKVSDRRASTNAWMLSVNSAIVGFYSYLGQERALADLTFSTIGLGAVPVAGILVCMSWAALLSSYSKLNGAKFKVLHELEATLPSAIFTREREIYAQSRRRGLSKLELTVPWSFAALYACLLVAVLARSTP